MIQDVLELAFFLLSASSVVILPGSPISIQALNDGFAVGCEGPSSICFVHNSTVSEVAVMEVFEPRDLCIWNGELTASDFEVGGIVVGNRSFSVPGNPDGICEVYWSSSTVPELAIALFNPGSILLMNLDGSFTTLIEMDGVKSLASCDVDNDGDIDLFASGCGTGVVLVENRDLLPVTHEVGSIEAGVKRCFANDMDLDGDMDVAGIACAEGGVGWWRNPGTPEAKWHYQEIDFSIEGPKSLFCRGEIVAVASVNSSSYFSSDPGIQIPAGFTCCWMTNDSVLVLGHKLGFLVFFDFDILENFISSGY